MIRTIIIEDEQHCTDRLLKLLNDMPMFNIKVIGTAFTVSDGVALLKKEKPDLVFLDIQLGNETGFDFLNQVEEEDFKIIFCTAFDNYAVQAFRCSAIDYLLKPVDKEELHNSLLKIKNLEDKNFRAQQLQVLLQNLTTPLKKIAIPDIKGIVFVPVKDIVRCEGNVNYTSIYLRNGEHLIASKTLKEFEDILTAYNFFRIHKSHLINLEAVQRYIKGTGGSIILDDGMELDVSVRRKEEFLKRMKEG